MRMRAAHHLAADLVAIFGIDQPALPTIEGALDPCGATINRKYVVYQHVDHLSLPVDTVSPIERLQRSCPSFSPTRTCPQQDSASASPLAGLQQTASSAWPQNHPGTTSA
jgi:hypothetical protein